MSILKLLLIIYEFPFTFSQIMNYTQTIDTHIDIYTIIILQKEEIYT